MERIRFKGVPCETIYEHADLIERLARENPDVADKFAAQHPDMVQKWTKLDERVSVAFDALQSGWLAREGSLYVSDMWRDLPSQIKCYKEKTLDRRAKGLPGLAKPPAWSMHWLGCAVDFDVGHLDRPYDEFRTYAEDMGWRFKERWHIQWLPGMADASDGDRYAADLVKDSMPLTIEGIRERLNDLGYPAEQNMSEAVVAFQTAFGLQVDGVPGNRTQLTLLLASLAFEEVC